MCVCIEALQYLDPNNAQALKPIIRASSASRTQAIEQKAERAAEKVRQKAQSQGTVPGSAATVEKRAQAAKAEEKARLEEKISKIEGGYDTIKDVVC
jgi:hypothetical protein